MTTYFIGFFAPLKKFDSIIPPSFYPIPLDQRHMTLLYLGSISDPSSMCAQLTAIKHGKIKVRFKGLQAFPSETMPRYLAAVPTNECHSLLRELHTELSTLFTRREDRYSEFKPHVSIAYTSRKTSVEVYMSVRKTIKISRTVAEDLVVDKLCLISAEEGIIRTVCCVDLD